VILVINTFPQRQSKCPAQAAQVSCRAGTTEGRAPQTWRHGCRRIRRQSGRGPPGRPPPLISPCLAAAHLPDQQPPHRLPLRPPPPRGAGSDSATPPPPPAAPDTASPPPALASGPAPARPRRHVGRGGRRRSRGLSDCSVLDEFLRSLCCCGIHRSHTVVGLREIGNCTAFMLCERRQTESSCTMPYINRKLDKSLLPTSLPPRSR
jgi:hypothetical protein